MSRSDTERRFVRRRRSRWLRLLATVLATLALAGLVGLGVWAVWFSSWLAVEDVEILGQDAVPQKLIDNRAEVPVGEPLATVDLSGIDRRVSAIAGVRDVDVARQWPNTVRLSITERTPLAVVEINDRYRALDAEGVVFRGFRKPPEGLPLVVSTVGASSAALREAAAVASSLPEDVAGRVEHLEVRTIDQVELKLRDGRRVVWGSSAESEQKAEVLAALLSEEGRVYDVSVPGQPTVSG